MNDKPTVVDLGGGYFHVGERRLGHPDERTVYLGGYGMTGGIGLTISDGGLCALRDFLLAHYPVETTLLERVAVDCCTKDALRKAAEYDRLIAELGIGDDDRLDSYVKSCARKAAAYDAAVEKAKINTGIGEEWPEKWSRAYQFQSDFASGAFLKEKP